MFLQFLAILIKVPIFLLAYFEGRRFFFFLSSGFVVGSPRPYFLLLLLWYVGVVVWGAGLLHGLALSSHVSGQNNI